MSNGGRVSGEVAIVTGAAAGIGEAIAKTFAREGACVAIADIDVPGAERVVREIAEKGGEAIAIGCDVTQSSKIKEMVAKVLARWDRIDILVNNAGGFNRFTSFLQIGEEEWDQVFALNLKSVFLCSQAVSGHMMQRKKGRIINIASRAALAPNPGGPDYLPYGASKAGVIGFTRLLARELGPYGITVNSISPGTAMTERVIRVRGAESLKKIAETAPLGHLVEPQDIAEAALFLASAQARYITGINLNVNAGMYMM